MVSFAKLHIIRQRIRKKYKNIGLENFLLSIHTDFPIGFRSELFRVRLGSLYLFYIIQLKWIFCLVNTMYNTIVKNNTFKKVYESIV
jgi:hypothetical protein